MGDFTDTHIRLAAEWLSRSTPTQFMREVQFMSDGVGYVWESELERAFHVWLLAYNTVTDTSIRAVPQHQIEAAGNKYRLDFALGVWDWTKPLEPCQIIPIAVELDGHAFHEKTLEQVTRRNQRDRDLQSIGWKVLHFSFSEFHADPVECIRQTVEAAQAHLYGEEVQSHLTGS